MTTLSCPSDAFFLIYVRTFEILYI